MEENKEKEMNVQETNNEQIIPTSDSNIVNQNSGKKNSNKGLIIGLVIIILLLIAALCYVLFFNKDKEEGNKPTATITPTPNDVEETPTPIPQDEENQTSQGDYELTVYKEKDSGYLSNLKDKTDYLTEAFTIKVKNKNAKVIGVNYNSKDLLLYDDNGLYIYDNKTKSSKELNLENSYSEYSIYLNEKKDKIIGIGYLDENKKYGYYNVNLDKKLYNAKYKVEDLYSVTQINDNYLSLTSGAFAYLLSSESESTKLSYKDSNTDLASTNYMYENFGKNGNYIYALGYNSDPFPVYEKFYSNNFKLFYESKANNGILEEFLDFNNYLYFAEGDYELGYNKLLKYNTNGELISTYTNFTNIKMVENGYVVYVKDNNLILENIEDNSESKVLTNMKSNWSFDSLDSGYYTRELLDNMGEKNKKEGLYVVIDYDNGYTEDGHAKKDSSGYYGIEYCYTPDKQVVEYPIKEEKGGRAKPVLYLYPTKETNVTVKFANPNLLTTTYPKYINSWNVTAKPNGDLTDKDGKYYYALYWDEKRYNEVDFHEGFYVESKDAIKFLEEKLTYIGLSDKERNEFIMYWLPIMENNKKNVVYFELTEDRELGNKLIIEPKPDSLLRVSIHIKKVNEKVIIPEQKLKTFKRVGFTAVEWGGMTY